MERTLIEYYHFQAARGFWLRKWPNSLTGTFESLAATSEHHRGKGTATTIIRHIHDSTPYGSYALELAYTNTNARKLSTDQSAAE